MARVLTDYLLFFEHRPRDAMTLCTHALAISKVRRCVGVSVCRCVGVTLLLIESKAHHRQEQEQDPTS